MMFGPVGAGLKASATTWSNDNSLMATSFFRSFTMIVISVFSGGPLLKGSSSFRCTVSWLQGMVLCSNIDTSTLAYLLPESVPHCFSQTAFYPTPAHSVQPHPPRVHFSRG